MTNFNELKDTLNTLQESISKENLTDEGIISINTKLFEMEELINNIRANENMVLNEGLGVTSYLNRHFTGIDKGIEGRIKKQLDTMKSEAERQELLNAIDSAINTARTYNLFKNTKEEPETIKNFLKTAISRIPMNLSIGVGADVMSAGDEDVSKSLRYIAVVISLVTLGYNNTTGKTAEFLNTLKLLRDDVAKYPIKAKK